MDKKTLTHTFAKGIRLLFIAALVAGLALGLMPVMEAHAATITVINTDDSGAGSLRQAIIDANVAGGDEIVFSLTLPATITLTSGELVIDKDLTITGPGAADLTISGDDSSRIFKIDAGKVVTISGVTITNGFANEGGEGDKGGGIYSEGTLTLNDCIVSNNRTAEGAYIQVDPGGDGGGIYSTGTLTLNNSTVSGNTTGGGGFGQVAPDPGGYGGGIYSASTLTLNNSTVSGNTTGEGGSVDSGSGGNGGYGGGIYSAGTATLTNSTVSGNTTGIGGPGPNGGDGGDGGGIYNSGALVLNNSTVSGNTTGDGGSGVNGGDSGDGGGIWTASTLELNNCTIASNTTGSGGSGSTSDGEGGYGGGIYETGGMTVNLKNTIIAKNTAAGQGPDAYGTLTSFGSNLIEDTTGCTIVGNTTGNITGQDPLLGPLADYGGPTQTRALQWALGWGSPAIDAVIDCTTIGGVNVNQDQRGEPRPVDGDGDGSAVCDIGAYEAPPAPPLPPAVGGIVEPVDRVGLLAPWIVLAVLLIAGMSWFALRRRSAVS